MHKDIYKEYVLKNILREKRNTKTIIILFFLAITIIFIFSYKKTIETYFTNGIEKNPSYRTILVIRNEDISEENAINEIKKISHVEAAFSDTAYYTILATKNKYFSGDFSLTGSTNKTHPPVTNGKNIQNKNEIVCPETFYPSENISANKNLTKQDFINMKKLINKEIAVEYIKIIDENTDETEIKTVELKIVGTYKNSKAYLDESSCYGNYNLLNEIYNDAYENVDLSNQIDSIVVQVDSAKNVDLVIDKLNSLKRYNSIRALEFDDSLIETLNIIVYVVTGLCLIFSFITIIYITEKNLNLHLININILRTIGYRNKDIEKINYLNTNFLMIIIFLILVISVTIFQIIYITIIYFKPLVFSKLPICVDYTSILLSIIVIALTYNLSTYIYNKKVFNMNIIKSIKE